MTEFREYTDEELDGVADKVYLAVDAIQRSEEYELVMDTREALNAVTGVTTMLDGVDTMDDKMIMSIESVLPGFVLNNLPYEMRYGTEGKEEIKQAANQLKERMIATSSKATIVIIDKFANAMRSMSGTNIKEGVVSSLLAIKGATNDLKHTTEVSDNEKLMEAYQELMGVKPESAEKVIEMIGVIKEKNSALECLKTFPNDKYDRIFTPLLASTVSESSKIFKCFDDLNQKYARQLLDTVEKVKTDLETIMTNGDYKQLTRYQESLIPDEIMETITEVVGSLNVELDHRKGILKQTSSVSQHMAKMLKPSEESLRKKASVVNAIIHRHKELDKAFKDITEASGKLSQYSKDKDVDLKALRSQMREFKAKKPLKERAKAIWNDEYMKHGANHHRILNELDDVWSLIDLMVKMSISYSTSYGVVKLTLDKFKTNYANFVKTVNSLTTAEAETSAPTEEGNEEDESTV